MCAKRGRISVTIILVLVALLFVIPFALSVTLYELNFSNRYETYPPYALDAKDYAGLDLQRYTFLSNRGQELVGYKYYKNFQADKGIIITAHGLGGGGHNTYLDVINHFCSEGYVVFAYDTTGNDESGGKSVRGLPQGPIDLNHAIQFVKGLPELKDLPIMLFGHSWGGYSVGSVLNLQPDVRAVVMVAGFDKSLDMIHEAGKEIVGKAINLLLPYVSLYERIKFGKHATLSSIAGFENSDAAVMVVYSADDEVISSQNGFDVFYDVYQSDPRFKFIKYEDRGHNYVYRSEAARTYKDGLNQDFRAYIESLDGELTAELKLAYLNEHLDKGAMYDLDQELMTSIVRFYDQNLKLP